MLVKCQYFLESVGRPNLFGGKHFFFGRKSIKIVTNTLKIEEKFSDVPNFFRVCPIKVGLVGFLETDIFFFFSFCLMMPEALSIHHHMSKPNHEKTFVHE